ncbi:sugar ABC transporter ATP-binding protein [Maritalea sp. S77]|uniref:sugar ABC transporter ATP-binding protein n=1 Tax=Maritalea sp. S77 TaxID=3415125 RepID=UPI003C7B6810
MDHSNLLAVKGLTKQYPGIIALNEVDFDLREGEVHVLFGENGAGKSTLISMLAGATQPTAGQILVKGQEVEFDDVSAAQRAGIYTVFQEFSLIPTLSVAQNIFLGWEPKKGPFLNKAEMRKRSREMLAELGFDMNPDQIVAHLSRAQQQMVEITKAFHADIAVLILDEPTASLTDKEVDHLFDFIERLKHKGVGIVYISHRIQEFARIADRVTVLRDGAKVGEVAMAETDDSALIEMMTGRKISEIYPTIQHEPGETILKAKNLSTFGVNDASFDVRRGEVLGIAGLVGSGKSRLVRALMGLASLDAGKVMFHGKDISHDTTQQIIRQGIHYLSPDRKTEGLDLLKTSDENLAVNLVMLGDNQAKAGLVRWANVKNEVDDITSRVELNSSYRTKPVSQLSGGNQQKVLFGKCFAQQADIYIFDEPTVGVDIGTRAALYRLIQALAESGKAVIIVSSDLPEVMNLSHRLLVMAHGKLTALLDAKDCTEDKVLKYFFDESGVDA